VGNSAGWDLGGGGEDGVARGHRSHIRDLRGEGRGGVLGGFSHFWDSTGQAIVPDQNTYFVSYYSGF
jgi:hypothetical protein